MPGLDYSSSILVHINQSIHNNPVHWIQCIPVGTCLDSGADLDRWTSATGIIEIGHY